MAIRTIMRLPEVEKASGHGKSQLYALMRQGLFPRPVNISKQSVGWWSDEIQQWQEDRQRAEGGWSPRDRKRQRAMEAGQ
jgi:prophage regulatory protein